MTTTPRRLAAALAAAGLSAVLLVGCGPKENLDIGNDSIPLDHNFGHPTVDPNGHPLTSAAPSMDQQEGSK